MLLQEANNKNQAFQSSVQSLDYFLHNIPNNKVLAGDDTTQINNKHNSQKVPKKGTQAPCAVSVTNSVLSCFFVRCAGQWRLRATGVRLPSRRSKGSGGMSS